jgi:hypothetical protein
MPAFKDITGRHFGRWTILKFAGLNKYGKARWLCECVCGTQTIRVGHDLTRKRGSKGCHDCAGIDRQTDITGQRFGKLVVINRATERKWDRRLAWICRCDCGHELIAAGKSLRNGKTTQCRSCGKTFHGRSGTHLYGVWSSMVTRCTNSNNHAFPYYGGRGIQVCERWRKFENFLADMGERPSTQHSLDRIDVNGNYSPDNCRWTTSEVQVANRRKAALESFTINELVAELKRRDHTAGSVSSR